MVQDLDEQKRGAQFEVVPEARAAERAAVREEVGLLHVAGAGYEGLHQKVGRRIRDDSGHGESFDSELPLDDHLVAPDWVQSHRDDEGDHRHGVLAEAVQELPVQVAQAEEEKAGHVVDDVLLREGRNGVVLAYFDQNVSAVDERGHNDAEHEGEEQNAPVEVDTAEFVVAGAHGLGHERLQGRVEAVETGDDEAVLNHVAESDRGQSCFVVQMADVIQVHDLLEEENGSTNYAGNRNSEHRPNISQAHRKTRPTKRVFRLLIHELKVELLKQLTLLPHPVFELG